MEISDEVGRRRVRRDGARTARRRRQRAVRRAGPGADRAERPKLLIDFAGIDFVTSAGLRVVLTILKRVKSLNGAFALCGVQKPVREVLDITGFAGMIDIHPGRAAALAALCLTAWRAAHMTEATAIAASRRWHQSIAAKLLIAFGLIAALTVGASWLSLIRFNEVETVIRRTTDVSLPLVKLSLDHRGADRRAGRLRDRARRVRDRAAAVPAHGEGLRADQPALEHASEACSRSAPTTAATARLQEILATLNGELGAIDRNTREFVLVTTRRKAAIERVAAVNGADARR